MPQYIAPHPGIEVSGTPFALVIEALGTHGAVAKKVLSTLGVPEIAEGGWYPLQLFLDLLKGVAQASGDHTLLAIGKMIVERAVWPAMPSTIEASLAMVDVAYHMNNRLDGEIMVDPETGVMKEGIGHYRCYPQGDREVVMVCDSPYPSELDRGILLGTARRAAPRALKLRVDVTLDESRPSRKHGADSCTYRITW
ncbi:hypothetical protein [Sorangium sp. So ce131]|uniref:hypothetical protein n=1 Tax=Sorangium sp. So ce131 TaxID=3133282 RepID=UPI003F61F23D